LLRWLLVIISSFPRRTITEHNASSTSSSHAAAALIVKSAVILLRTITVIVIGIGMEVSAFVSVHLCLRRRTSIAHRDVVGTRVGVSQWAIFRGVLVACVCIRRGSILSMIRWQLIIISSLSLVLLLLLSLLSFF